jgi:hypothetical protein
MPVPNNPFQNPFYNRFNDPVTRRHDEMDTYAWLCMERIVQRESQDRVVSTANEPARSDKNPATDYRD